MDFSQYIQNNSRKIRRLLSATSGVECISLVCVGSCTDGDKHLEITFNKDGLAMTFCLRCEYIEDSEGLAWFSDTVIKDEEGKQSWLEFGDAEWINAEDSDINRVHSWMDFAADCDDTFGDHSSVVKQCGEAIRIHADKLNM